MEKKLNIHVDYDWREECLLVEGKINDIDSTELQKLDLKVTPENQDSSWYVTATLKMGDVFLNNQCLQVIDPYTIKCDYYLRGEINKNEAMPTQKHYEKNNVEIIFYEAGDGGEKVKSITIIIKIKLSENNKNTSDFPVDSTHPALLRLPR